jgi:uncharacterized membrane protein
MPRVIGTTYVVVAAICGVIMVFLSPPFQAPDEVNHFFRAWTLAQGRLLAVREGGLVGAPVSVAVFRWVSALVDDLPFHPENKQTLGALISLRDVDSADRAVTFVDFRNSALYSPVAYVPQAVGLGVGRRLLGWPLLDSYYLARLLNLLSSVALCWWACSRLPYGRLPFVLIALCPMFLFEQASLSADSLTYGLAAAFCASVLQVSRSGDHAPLASGVVMKLGALGALVTLTKPSSAPLPLFAVLLLGCRRHASPGRPWRETMTVIGISWAALLAWSLLVQGLYVPAHPFVAVEPGTQLAYILARPLRFAGVVWHTLVTNWHAYYLSAVGVLGWLDTPLKPRYVDYFYWTLLASGLVGESSLMAASRRERALAAFLVLSTIGLFVVIMYLTWTAVGGPMVEGLQGRYLLSLAVPWAVLIQWPAAARNRLGTWARSVLTIACLIYSVFFLGHGLQALLRRYWL